MSDKTLREAAGNVTTSAVGMGNQIPALVNDAISKLRAALADSADAPEGPCPECAVWYKTIKQLHCFHAQQER